MKKLIYKYYKEAVLNKKDMKQELKDALKIHERMPFFLANIEKEIKAFQAKTRAHVGPDKIKEIVELTLDIFVNSVEAQAQERSDSILEKLRRREEREKQEELDRILNNEQQMEGLLIKETNVESQKNT